MNIRYPNITGKNSTEQLQQIRSFLFQLVEQLNLESFGSADGTPAQTSAALQGSTDSQAQTPASTFNQIKSLIIKSADIIDAYYEEVSRRLEGTYVAESQFGTYRQELTQEIAEAADKIEQNFRSIQSIEGQLQNMSIETQANIRSGLLFTVGEETLEEELGQTLPDGAEVFGVEIGQTTIADGKEVFHKFARFTSYGMTLYDNNGNLSAYITDRRLHIANAEIKNSLTRGGYVETINSDGSSVERWVGV